MQADQPISRPAFCPGDRVRVVSGESTALSGEVVDHLEGWVFWRQADRRNLTLDWRPGQVCVALTIFGTRVPVWLNGSQLEPVR